MIENWVKPIKLTNIMGQTTLEDYHFGNSISIYEDKLPNLNSAQIVIIGLDESESKSIRRQLYRCSFLFDQIKIVDLGNIRNKENSFIIPLLSELIHLGITPILIGGRTNQFRAQLLAHREKKRELGLSIVSKNLRLLHTILTEFSDLSSDVFVKYFYGLAIQMQYTNPHLFKELEKNSYEILRLGKMQEDIKEVEAFIRNSDCFCFDISSIRSTDAPGQINPTAGGLFLEQACQTARYAGLSDDIGSFGIYGYHEALDSNNITVSTIAQLVWYFIDGYQYREDSPPNTKEGMLEFVVDYEIKDGPVSFYKSTKSGKWWLDISFMNNKKGVELIPVSYSDYVALCNDEISERILKVIKRKFS